MARSSAARAAQATAREPFAELERRAKAAPPGARLSLSNQGFDVIAELKLNSPAAGRLGAPNEDWLKRVTAYAQGFSCGPVPGAGGEGGGCGRRALDREDVVACAIGAAARCGGRTRFVR